MTTQTLELIYEFTECNKILVAKCQVMRDIFHRFQPGLWFDKRGHQVKAGWLLNTLEQGAEDFERNQQRSIKKQRPARNGHGRPPVQAQRGLVHRRAMPSDRDWRE